MSAFSCGPGHGSEPGIGWNWAIEAARQGHDVIAITQSEFASEIRNEIEKGTVPSNLRFDFFTPNWIAWIRDVGSATRFSSLTWHSVHLLWQFALRPHVRATYKLDQFDIIHHITLGGVRHPTLLGGLGAPLVLGPLGGGEKAPIALRRHYPWSGWLKDLARDAHTALIKIDPITRRASANALLIWTKTPQSRDVIGRAYQHKVRIGLELGTKGCVSNLRIERDRGRPVRILYAGQFVYWKGMGLGLRAVAQARAAGHDLRLTMVGRGSEERDWRKLAEQLGLSDVVTWHEWVAHDEMPNLYREHELFLFPSLHDSSGNVVLEALSHALPVICLKLGGPAEIVDESCGRPVDVAGKPESACVAGLAAAICELASSPETSLSLSQGAVKRAEQFRWPLVISKFYADVENRLRQSRVESGQEHREHPKPPLFSAA